MPKISIFHYKVLLSVILYKGFIGHDIQYVQLDGLSGVNDTAELNKTVTMTPQSRTPQCHGQ